MLTIQIDSRIRFDSGALPAHVKGMIQEALLLENPDKATARKQKIPGWQRQPDYIKLYQEFENGEMWVPRGFARDLFAGLDAMGVECTVLDSRVDDDGRCSHFGPRARGLREHQEDAIQAYLETWGDRFGAGILEAPPGSGKTITVLEIIRRAGCSAVIVVNTTNIAAQWRERAMSWLGVETGMVGDGEMDFRPDGITLATAQTLYNLPFVHEIFEVGLACMDEVHHVSAMTFSKVMQRFHSKYRLGVSATPDRHTGWFQAVEAVIGPVVHRVTKQDLSNRGFLVRPTIHVVKTSFNHYYQPTHEYRKGSSCETPGCEKSGQQHSHRNNYSEIMGALALDQSRANLVADNIVAYPDGRHLVVSRRLEHLRLMMDTMLSYESFPPDRLMMLTGKETTQRRVEVAAQASEGPCVVFSTIADEALDIPELDHIHLAWPTKNPAVITQQLGRVERAAPGKTEAHVWDYVDEKIGVLRAQARKRAQEVYEEHEYRIQWSEFGIEA